MLRSFIISEMRWQEGPSLLRTGGSSQASARHQREKPQLIACPRTFLSPPVANTQSKDLPHPMDHADMGIKKCTSCLAPHPGADDIPVIGVMTTCDDFHQPAC